MVAPLVLAGIGAASSLAGSLFGNSAAKKTQRARQGILDNLVTTVQRPQFDFRMANTRAGDRTQLDLSQQGLNARLGNRSAGVGDILSRTGAGFNTSLGLRDTNSQEQTGIQLGNIAANRDVRVNQAALHDAELAKQRTFQAEADTLAAGYKTTAGAPQFGVDKTGAVTGRNAAVDAAVTGPSPDASGTTAVNPLLKTIFAAELAKGMNEATTRAKKGNEVRGYGDALVSAGRRNVNFSDALALVDAKAGISASALPAELAVGAIERDNAGAAAEMRSQIADAFFGGSISANDTRTSQGVDNAGGYYDTVGTALDGNFNRLSGAEADRTGALNNNSSEYEQGRTRTADMRAQSTSYTSPLGTLLSQVGGTLMSKGLGGLNLGGAQQAVPIMPAPRSVLNNFRTIPQIPLR